MLIICNNCNIPIAICKKNSVIKFHNILLLSVLQKKYFARIFTDKMGALVRALPFKEKIIQL